MTRAKTRIIFDLLVLSFIILTGLILFSDHFKFGLTQDVTRVLFYDKLYSPAANIRALSFFIQPYSGQYFLMFILNLFFGYEAKWYFITSFILRVIAAYSIYLLGRFIFKNKFIGLAASLIFIVGYAGIQSSIPVISPAYLSIAFMNLGLVKLFTYFQEKKKKILDKVLLKSYFWLFLAFVISPFSMHGLIFLFPIILIGAALLKINRAVHSAAQIIIFFSIVLLIKRLGFTDTIGTAREVSNHLLSLDYFLKIQNPLKTLLYPLTSFYQMVFIPEFNPLHGSVFMPIFSGLRLHNLPNFLLLLAPPLLLAGLLTLNKKGNRFGLSILFIFWVLFLFALRTIFPESLSGEGAAIFLGGLITFLVSIFVIVLAKSKKDRSLLLITFLFWPFSFSLIPHLAYPSISQETTSRYLTVSEVGVSFLVIYLSVIGIDFLIKKVAPKIHDVLPRPYGRGFLLFLRTTYQRSIHPCAPAHGFLECCYKPKSSLSLFKSGFLIIFLGIIFITNFKMTREYFKSEGEKGNYSKYIDSYFEIMNREIGDRIRKKRPVAYLELQNTDSTFVFVSIIDGGPERFSILNDNLSENAMPFFVTSRKQLVAIFCNNSNKDFNPFILKPGIEDLFAFKIDNQQLSIETARVRKEILSLSYDFKTCPEPLILQKTVNSQRKIPQQ